MTDKDILYVGCARGVYGHSGGGHYQYLCTEYEGKWYMDDKGLRYAEPLHPDFLNGELEGGFCSEETTKAFQAKVTRIEGFTVLAFWDYSGDSRPGSSSTFVMRGFHHFPEMIVKLEKALPDLFKRFGQTVEMYELEERTGGS